LNAYNQPPAFLLSINFGLSKNACPHNVVQDGLVSPDPDFPDDDAENWYFVPGDKSLTAATSIGESTEAKGVAAMDSEMAEALLGAGGALSKDACMRIPGMQNRESEKAFLQMYESSVGNLPGVAMPVIKDDDSGEPEPTKPLTGIDKARILLPKILSEGQLAGGFVVSLQAHDMSDRIVTHMKEHQLFMNSAYKLLQNKVCNGKICSYLIWGCDSRYSSGSKVIPGSSRSIYLAGPLGPPIIYIYRSPLEVPIRPRAIFGIKAPVMYMCIFGRWKIANNDDSGYTSFTKLVEKKMAINVNSTVSYELDSVRQSLFLRLC
jgi:hypothetical protein